MQKKVEKDFLKLVNLFVDWMSGMINFINGGMLIVKESFTSKYKF